MSSGTGCARPISMPAGAAQRRADHRRAGRAPPPARREPRPAHAAGPPEKSRGLLRQGERSGSDLSLHRGGEGQLPIACLCRHLGVSASGYYAWRMWPPSARPVAGAGLSTTIRQIHGASRGTYGAPRIHAELADAYGLRYGRKRVARLMRRAGLVGVCRRRVVRTTRAVATPPLPT
jgi:hypothetical protein